jgi:murein DD-endopeptidase MepM/ murein hydrolase activator NlpD
MALISQILPKQGLMGLDEAWQTVVTLIDRVFVPREVILRASGQVTYFRLSSRTQKLAFAALCIVTWWASFATTSHVVQRDTLAAKDRTIAGHQSAYQNLESDLTQALADQARLAAQIAGLSLSLGREIEIGGELAQQREALERRVDGLRQRLTRLREAHEGVIQRFSELAMTRANAVEAIIAVTGLDAEKLLASIEKSSVGTGGPLIPVDESAAGLEANAGLTVSLAGLNDQWGRLFALQEVRRILPLTPPLGQFWISSAYGERKDPFTGEKSHHAGVDLVAPLGSGIRATAPGRVVFAGKRDGYGRTIEIDHGQGITTRFAHLSKLLVEDGQHVERGQKIGTLGNSGRSSGPHLHYEIRSWDETLNPIKFMEAGTQAFEG